MTIAIAHKLYEMGFPGMKDKDGNFLLAIRDRNGVEQPVWEFENYYKMNVDEALYNEYRLLTFKKHKDLAPYDVLAKHTGLRWPVVQGKDGVFRETKFRFSEFSDPYVKKGAGIQFYHSVTKDDKAQIWFCPYEAPPEMPDKNYPFWLCTGRVIEHWHTGTMTMRVKQLRNALPSSYIELNPSDASALGLMNGDLAKVSSRRGEMVLPVWVNGRSKPPKGSVFVPFFDETKLINEVTLENFCPVSKEPDYKKCAVNIEKYQA